MMEIAAEVIKPVVKLVSDHIIKDVGYWAYSKKNVEDLGTRMKLLNEAAKDVETEMDENAVRDHAFPHHHVSTTWLKDVRKINEAVAGIPTVGTGNGCLNIKRRYKAGKQSSDVLKKIKSLEETKPKLKFNHENILARVAFKNAAASTSAARVDDRTQDSYNSRDLIFRKALESLESNNSKTRMMALCGMGGVGKSHMMERLKKHVEDTKMFNYVVKVVVGQNTGLFALQHALAEKTGGPLTETTSDGRVERLTKRFLAMSKDGEKKILVILDDLWKELELKDIGLPSPLANGFKLLITSRDTNVCTWMGVDIDLIFKIGDLNDDEAKKLFFETVQLSKDDDRHDLFKIGEDIIKRCGKLPIALKTIASILRGHLDNEPKWKGVRYRLEQHDLADLHENVNHVFKISYDNLNAKDEQAVFLLTGLFPDDFDIPVEELMRYGWGLKLFTKLYATLAEARNQMNECVDNLIHANLLTESDSVGCVRLHDLARVFILSYIAEVKQASILNYAELSKQFTQGANECYQRILFKCTGMSTFPQHFDFPDLTFLKLMDGDELSEFPQDFYKNMGNLQVVSFEDIRYPLLPRSTNLTTLCLNGCTLISDFSSIGDLVNLQVLSFANCRVKKLPSAIGMLNKLKLLDLTGCLDLCIEDGVFQNLVNLEELYMRVHGSKAIGFTDANCEELKVFSAKLVALEVEFFDKAQTKDMSFTNLERFRISIGCLLEEDKDIYSLKNTLKLVSNSSELLRWKINELFEKTEKLHLQVNDVKHLSQHSFSKLRVLEVVGCADLRYLFTISMAGGLRKLERLKVSSCPVLGSLIHGDQRANSGAIIFQELKFLALDKLPKLGSFSLSTKYSFSNLRELEVSDCADLTFLFTIPAASGFTKLEHLTVSSCSLLESLIHGNQSEIDEITKFQALKFLVLNKLPKLGSLCNIDKVVELPELVELRLADLPNFTSIYPDSTMRPFFNIQAAVPKLEKLKISSMEKLNQIWPCEISNSNEEVVNYVSKVRVVKVKGCDSLVNLFPINPMSLLRNLEKLQVKECGSVEVLFNIDLGQRSNSDAMCGCWPAPKLKPPKENINAGRVGNFEEVSSCLRSIRVERLGKLEVLWRIKGANKTHPLSCFQSVKNIHINGCRRFTNTYTPTTASFDMKAHVDIRIQDSRDSLFNKALKSLQPEKTRKIALCGVGNVGKTTLIYDLVEAAKDLQMFDIFVKLVIGRESDPFALQEATGKCIGEVLKENNKEARAQRLCRKFTQMTKDGKTKILVILDDLQKVMDLKDIGLPGPLPNGVNLLITSRDENVCTRMGVDNTSIFRVPLLRKPEAKVLFYQTLRPSDGDSADPELHKIAEDVVEICCGMPFLIKAVASFLRDETARSTWEAAYFNLKQNHLNLIYQGWYEQLVTEDAKEVLLLSGLFLEEDDILIEDLVRYALGLRLFGEEVDTVADARKRIKDSIDVLIHANMLIRSDHVGSVQMQRPLRGFALSKLSKVKQALIDHDNTPRAANELFERILINCTGMTEFPADLNYGNLRLLKLMGEKKLFQFPQNFYGKMEKLMVLGYERMDYPVLPQHSTSVRTLCLRSCSLVSDISFLSSLSNLEILSFAHCGIRKLPSTIQNLRKLKVLDVTGCVDLSVDDGVFVNLVNLEELYMRGNGSDAIGFTDANFVELESLSWHLCALEVEFYKKNLRPKFTSFNRLERFNISMGCLLDDSHIDPSGNTLKLEENHSKLLESGVYQLLIEKTKRLYLQVEDMENLEAVSMQYSFCNLRELEVSNCADLMFLFTVSVASGFTKLERLTVSSCPVLKALVHGESGGGTVIMFQGLKFLYLKKLPRLMSLCDADNRVELQQLVELTLDDLPNIRSIYPDNAIQPYAFFNKQVMIPKLEKLKISLMKKLKQIWPCEITTTGGSEEEVDNISKIRVVEVQGCDSLVNLFPTNPMPLLLNLEKLQVKNCDSIQVLFNIDLGFVGETKEVSSSLRSIEAVNLRMLGHVWSIQGAIDSRPIRAYQAVENIQILNCLRFRDVFTPKTTNFEIRANIHIFKKLLRSVANLHLLDREGMIDHL